MRLNRWLFTTCVLGAATGAMAPQACSTGNYCTGSGASETCFIYTPEPIDASAAAVTKHDAGRVDGAADAYVPWEAGTGAPCPGPVGAFPVASCDPSDESAPGCGGGVDAGCVYSPKCGDLTTCEPFRKNPTPGTGVDTFRLRLINLTAPPALLMGGLLQSGIVTASIDLPSSPDAGGAPCGENGNGLFNWLMEVDKAHGTVTTGGAPPSVDPFGLGYCFIRAKVGAYDVAPITVPVTFAGDTFSSKPLADVIYIPIFLPDTTPPLSEAVILPISGLAVNDVTISDDGDCIGAVNNAAGVVTVAPNICTTRMPTGPGGCSRWHTAGTFSGYMKLTDADKVPVMVLGQTLCAILTGDRLDGGMGCTPAGFHNGDYCSDTKAPCAHGDSVWISAQFAASAVTIFDGAKTDAGLSLCRGGSLGG